MSTIAAAYLSYTSWSISQTSTATANAGTSSDGAASTASSSSSSVSVSVTTVSISHRAKQMLARASAERSAVDRLQAQVDAFQNYRRHGRDTESSAGLDFFKIVSGASDDSIRVQASNATIDSGAGNDIIDVDGRANVVAGDGDDTVS